MNTIIEYVLCYSAAFFLGFATCATVVLYFDLKDRKRRDK